MRFDNYQYFLSLRMYWMPKECPSWTKSGLPRWLNMNSNLPWHHFSPGVTILFSHELNNIIISNCKIRVESILLKCMLFDETLASVQIHESLISVEWADFFAPNFKNGDQKRNRSFSFPQYVRNDKCNNWSRKSSMKNSRFIRLCVNKMHLFDYFDQVTCWKLL